MSHHRRAFLNTAFLAGPIFFAITGLLQYPAIAIAPAVAIAQQPDESREDASPRDTPGSEGISNTPEQISETVNRLGARSFREREAAMAKLLSIGPTALPVLRQMEQTDDAELRRRIEIVTNRLINDDFEARATAFLDGKEGAVMPGWDYVSPRIGDRLRHREVFIELSRRHPAVVMLMDGSAKDRSEALKVLIEDMGPMMKDPNFADALGLLLLSSDEEIDAVQEGDQRLYSLLNHYVVKGAVEEPEFKEPVTKLLNKWVLKIPDSSRFYGMFVAMQWKLEAAPKLAEKILAKETNPDLLALTFRMLANSGTAQDSLMLKPFFADSRLMQTNYFYTDPAGRRLIVQIGDLAMASAAILNDRDPKSLGFPGARMQGSKMFDFETMGFPEGEVGEEARKRVRQEIEEMLAEVERAEIEVEK